MRWAASSTKRLAVFAYDGPCDMRKSFNTLGRLVEDMGHDVTDGSMYLFVSRNQRRAKVLWHDGTGLCLMAKRLDAGRFAAVWRRPDRRLNEAELRLFLDGARVVEHVVIQGNAPSLGRSSVGRKTGT